MQPAPGPLSEQRQGDAPLPPVLTLHRPLELPADAERLAAPYVAHPAAPGSGEWLPKPAEIRLTPAPDPEPAGPVEGFLPVGAALDLPYAEPGASDEWTDDPLPVIEAEPLAAFPMPDAGAGEPWTEFADGTFPLDAYIRPEGAPGSTPILESPPQRELAEAAAERLEALAARLRAEGFDALLRPGPDARPIDVVLASLLSGYVAR